MQITRIPIEIIINPIVNVDIWLNPYTFCINQRRGAVRKIIVAIKGTANSYRSPPIIPLPVKC